MAVSSDIWFGSRIHPGAEILVRVTCYQEADGMPGQELDLIGAVYPDSASIGYAARVGNQEQSYCVKAHAKRQVQNFVKKAGI